MKLLKYTLWFIAETVIIILFLALWWRQKEDDTMRTYASIKYAIRERIDSLETMLNMYEQDNTMRNNILIRIDELKSLMRVLKILEVEKENENEIKKKLLH